VNRVLVMLFVATLVAIALWDILRRNPQLWSQIWSKLNPPSSQPPRRVHRSAPKDVTPAVRGKVIELRRDPYHVLGVERDASPEEIAAQVERMRRENDPERMDGMSDELREHAKRRLTEVESAFAEIKDKR
jgi:DnaJ-domain-containing protein 1